MAERQAPGPHPIPHGGTHRPTVSASMPEGWTAMPPTSFLWPRRTFMASQPPPTDQTVSVPSAAPVSRCDGL